MANGHIAKLLYYYGWCQGRNKAGYVFCFCLYYVESESASVLFLNGTAASLELYLDLDLVSGLQIWMGTEGRVVFGFVHGWISLVYSIYWIYWGYLVYGGLIY